MKWKQTSAHFKMSLLLFLNRSNLVSIRISYKRIGNLQKVRNFANTKRVVSSDINEIRNMGVLAHIDAGKTSISECMLYHAGVVKKIGRIGDGDTQMDFMKQERERGITINAASISFNWKGRTINLIDTPGHVDFNFEVVRCLHVLDSAVLVIDSTEGVEAQTISVNKQMLSWGMSRIIFANKMDRKNADFSKSVEMLRNELDVNPIVCSWPVYLEGKFQGVVDLITMQLSLNKKIQTQQDIHLMQDDGQFNTEVIKKIGLSDENLNAIKDARLKLVEELVSFDEKLLEDYLEGNTPSTQDLKMLLRSNCVTNKLSPVLCGSAMNNTGIDVLLDAIVDFLPSPRDQIETHFPVNFQHQPDTPLVAYAFKVVNDKTLGAQVYFRVYSGTLRSNRQVYRVEDGERERINHLFLSLARELCEISSLGPGNIGVVAGLKGVETGEVITDDKQMVRELSDQIEEANESFVRGEASPSQTWLNRLARLHIPESVFYCTLYTELRDEEKDLLEALEAFTREDPSLKFNRDEKTEDIIVSGMGDLHLQILIDRLKHEYKVEVTIGDLNISYQEVPTIASEEEVELGREMEGREHHVQMRLRLAPKEGGGSYVKLVDKLPIEEKISDDAFKTIQKSIKEFCKSGGPLKNGPVHNMCVDLTSYKSEKQTSLNLVSYAARDCLAKALLKSELRLCEPVMKVVVKLPEQCLQSVLVDLTQNRRASVTNVTTDDKDAGCCLEAEVPLEHMLEYSGVMRSLTSGYGEYTSKFFQYRQMSDMHHKLITEK